MPLPPGLLLNPATGELTGTPTTPGTYVVRLVVRDALGNSRVVEDTIVITAYTLQSSSGDLGDLMATRPMTGSTLAYSGGQAPITYALLSGTLPDGLSINASTGAVTGTPTAAGAYAFTIRATDNLAQTKDTTLTGEIVANLAFGAASNRVGTVGVAKSLAAPSISGGTAPISYALASGSLPAGMSLSAATGAISGTPTTVEAPSGIALIATDANGFTATSGTFSIDIKAFPVLSGSLARGTKGTAYSSSYTLTGGHTPFAYTASARPAGVTINASTGVLSGTPTTVQTVTPLVTVTDAEGNSVSRSNAVPIAIEVSLTGSPPEATQNLSYVYQLATSGGWGPYTYEVTAGALPAGLTVNSSGQIIGNPTTQSSGNTATITVTDSDGNTDTVAANIDVAGALVVTGAVTALGTTTVVYGGSTLNASGGADPYTWSIVAGTFPPGLSLGTATGAISGTPTAAGTYNFTLRAADSTGSFVQEAHTITVAAFPVLSGTLIDASTGVAYSGALARTGGHLPLTYTIPTGSLPTGLSISSTTGMISGTPSGSGASSFTVRVTDDEGNIADRPQTITVYSVPTQSGAYTDEAEVTDPYSSSISVTGGKPSIAWSLAGGAMPGGLTLNASTGAITGTPNDSPGTYFFAVRATDALGRSDSSSHQIILRAKVVIASGPRQQATRTIAYSSGVTATGGWTPYTYAISGGALPAGLSLNASTGAITGTPTTTQNSSFTVRATDALGVVASYTTTIYVVSPVTLTGTASPGTVGVAYAFQPAGAGGWGPFTYTKVSGTLPAGCTLNASTGAVTGTPTAAATYNYTLRKTDTHVGGGSTATLACTTITKAKPVLTMSGGRSMVGKAGYSGTASVSGGHTPFSYSKVWGTLPNGISLNASTGALSGTPTAAGNFNFNIRVTDALGNIDDDNHGISIAAAMAIGGSYPAGTDNVAYDSTVNATGGWSPYTYSKPSGTLPTGLTLTSAGRLHGTPTTPGTYAFTLRATDADGSIKDKAMSVTIATGVVMSASAFPNPAYGSATTSGPVVTATTYQTISVVDAIGSVTYTWTFIERTGSGAVVSASGSVLRATLTDNDDAQCSETWRCVVRDSTGATATVFATFHLNIWNTN